MVIKKSVVKRKRERRRERKKLNQNLKNCVWLLDIKKKEKEAKILLSYFKSLVIF